MTKSNIDNYKLCMELLAADSEKIVSKILDKYELVNENNWEYFGDLENNFATIQNQQSEPEAALVEKLINSHDAVLLLNCKLNNIDPESENAPKTIDKALEDFLKVPKGDLSLLTTNERKKLANNIGLIATGAKRKPNLIVFDRGEGQSPKNFKNTFLSLNKSNKLRIPFVQGTFNMGGTGVLRFCGDKKYQLIISKKHKDLCDDKQNNWGFTLIKKFDPIDGMKNSTYKYLAPQGKILSFSVEKIDIPLKIKGTQDIDPLLFGSIIKLYNYQLSSGLSTIINFDLYNKISLLLPKIGIPIRFYERRDYSGHSKESTMSGLYVRLEDDKRDNIEEGFPSSFQFAVDDENFKAKIYVFKKESDQKYRKKEAIVFSINGQAHGFINTSTIKTKTKLSYLADSILVILDCNDISHTEKENLFMSSRDRMAKNAFLGSIEKTLIEILKDHPELKRLNNKRRSDLIIEKSSDLKPLKDVLNTLINRSPSLQALFIKGGDFSNPYRSINAAPIEKFIGKKYPSYFKIKKGQEDGDSHINQRIRIKFETDVRNDYFSRTEDPGEFALIINGGRVNNFSLNLWNGIATLNIEIPKDLKIGDQIDGELLITDNSLIDPYINKFHRIIKGKINISGGISQNRDSIGEKGKGTKSAQDNLSLPQIIDVKEEDWDKYSFNEYSALLIKGFSENGYDFYVNIDNKYLKHEIKQLKKEDESELLIKKFSTSMVLIGLAILQDRENNNNNFYEDIDFEELIKIISKSLAPIVLPMIDTLSKLDID